MGVAWISHSGKQSGSNEGNYTQRIVTQKSSHWVAILFYLGRLEFGGGDGEQGLALDLRIYLNFLRSHAKL